MNLKGKVVVITGATSGLGKELSKVFARAGAQVVLNGLKKSELARVAKEIGGFGILADISKEKDVVNLAKKTIHKFGRIDVWINNAGLWAPHAPVEKLDTKKLRKMIDVNLLGTIYCSKAALVQMKKQKKGIIINILSTSALTGRPGSSGYCASKYGAVGFTKSLASETQNTGIKVLAIYPGGMKTRLFDKKKPANLDSYMEPIFVAEKILANLEKENPAKELIIKNSNKVS